MGLATAEAFAEEGAAVALVDLNEAAVRKVAERLVAAGHKVIAIACDVTEEAQVERMVTQTVSAFGRLDAAFNNAGVQSLAVETADATSEEFDRVNAINLKSVWLCMKYELQQMRKQESGAVVNNSSIGGLIGIPAGLSPCHEAWRDWPDEECCPLNMRRAAFVSMPSALARSTRPWLRP